MPSLLGSIRDRISTMDFSHILFAAGLKAWNNYEETHKPRHLNKAIRNHQGALDNRGSDHPGRPESLYHTARALWAQYQLDGVTTKNASVVISYYDEALRLLPSIDEAGDRANAYNNLGEIYFRLFRLGEKNPKAFPAEYNLHKAIENHRSALKLRSARDDPNRPTSLINLSIALIQRDGDPDLTHAITYLGEAVELCSSKASSHHLLLSSLEGLANAYNSRYGYSEDINDVVGKIEALRKILDLTDEGKGRLIPLLNLTRALWGLCELEPNRVNDLDEAVHCGQEALKLSDNGDKVTHVAVLSTLAEVLYTRYARSCRRSMTDLQLAIQYYSDATDPGSEGGFDPFLYNSLASAIYTHCQDFGEVDGVTMGDAILYYQIALDACPTDNPLHFKIQDNLGNIYLTRYSKTGEEGDLVKGIRSYEDIVQPHSPNGDYTYHTHILEEAKRVLGDRREGRTDKGPPILTRRRSRTTSTWSKESSDESTVSKPSTKQPSISSLF